MMADNYFTVVVELDTCSMADTFAPQSHFLFKNKKDAGGRTRRGDRSSHERGSILAALPVTKAYKNPETIKHE